ncbi:MAG: type II secretion system protein GspF [Gammaproteobacteria bacterium]|nr:type II secretion system protein GspF [Gammaproteobacteria bacterium]
MAAFEFVALDERGRRRRGVREGDSRRQVRQALREEGLTPLSVDQTVERAGGTLRWSFRRGMSLLELALFTRQMATLVGAGLPIEEALNAVAQQTEKRRAGAMIMAVRGRVREGYALATALGEFPSTFPDMYRSTVAAGERSGFLDVVLENLADYIEARFESRRNVEMALFYPAVLLVFALLIVGALLIYVVPDIVRVFDDTGEQLPFLTQVMIAVSEFLQAWLWLVAVGAALFVFGLRRVLAQPPIRSAWDRRKLALPIAGRIVRGGNASRYASTLSILTSSGVPLVEAMRIAGEVVTNQWLKGRLGHATARVSEGASLKVALESAGHFPPMFLHMIGSGEASGELDTMLRKVAQYQQQELERLVTTLVRLFEPMMMLVMGVLVIVVVLAILLPILSMNQLVA